VTANGELSTTGADIHCSGELNELIALLILAVDKDRDGQWQSLPVSALRLGECLHRTRPWFALGGIYVAKSLAAWECATHKYISLI
jgi:hypothetical protein